MVRIKALRLLKGWTQQQLVERIAEHGVDITVAGISNVESGNRQASHRLLTAWASAFGLDPLDIWHGPLRPALVPADEPEQVA